MGLRAADEARWIAACESAGSRVLTAISGVDPGLLEEESTRLGRVLSGIIEQLSEGGTALVVGHTPTNEAGVLSLTGVQVDPLEEGSGVLLRADANGIRMEEELSA